MTNISSADQAARLERFNSLVKSLAPQLSRADVMLVLHMLAGPADGYCTQSPVALCTAIAETAGWPERELSPTLYALVQAIERLGGADFATLLAAIEAFWGPPEPRWW